MNASLLLAAALIIALIAPACSSDSDVSRSVGARCTGNDQCDGRCLSGQDYPDGFCTMACDNDRDCPGRSICTESEGGVCLFACDVPEDCTFLGTTWDCRTRDARPTGVEVMVCRGD